jgi:hypothetical protein
MPMRCIGIHLLTWGTIAGAVGSAVLLAALDSPLESKLAALPIAAWPALPGAARQAGNLEIVEKRPLDQAVPATPPPSAGAPPAT